MIPRLRTIAFLMLLAGLSLGVFATRALSVFSADERQADVVPASRAIEDKVQYYRDRFQLGAGDADGIRKALVEYERSVDAKLYEIRRQHAAEFDELHKNVNRRIQEVLSSAERGTTKER